MAVSRKYRVLMILSVSAILALAAKTVIVFRRYRKAERLFGSVQIGEARASVIGKMGRPHYHAGKCGVIHIPDKACAVEYVYSHPLAPIVPEYYIVSFSRDDRVIEAQEWSAGAHEEAQHKGDLLAALKAESDLEECRYNRCHG